MSFWSKWFGRKPAAAPPAPAGVIRLPDEPNVFECKECGKVFEARRLRAACPECDSTDVELMT